MVYSMGGLFSSDRKELEECKKSLKLYKNQNSRLQGINSTYAINEFNKTGGKRTRKYRRRN